MANRILISVQDGIEKPVWLDGVEPFIQTVMEKLSYDKEEISVLFCSNEFIQELNKNYRQIDSATDVLSFENGEEYEDEEGVWDSGCGAGLFRHSRAGYHGRGGNGEKTADF